MTSVFRVHSEPGAALPWDVQGRAAHEQGALTPLTVCCREQTEPRTCLGGSGNWRRELRMSQISLQQESRYSQKSLVRDRSIDFPTFSVTFWNFHGAENCTPWYPQSPHFSTLRSHPHIILCCSLSPTFPPLQFCIPRAWRQFLLIGQFSAVNPTFRAWRIMPIQSILPEWRWALPPARCASAQVRHSPLPCAGSQTRPLPAVGSGELQDSAENS